MSKQDNVITQDQLINQLNQIIMTQSRLAGAVVNLDTFMDLVVEQMQQLTPASGVVVELVDEDEMVYRAAVGTVKSHLGLRLPRSNSISGLCVATREVLYCQDSETDPRVNVQACRLVGARSMVVAPLLHHGNAVGVLKILSPNADGFSQQDIQTLQLMAGFLGSALANQVFHDTKKKLLREKNDAIVELKTAEEKLQFMVHHDYLTHLYNRSYFQEKLSSAIKHIKRYRKLIAVMYLDIDHFKEINDTLGHNMGDELLKLFSARILHSVRFSDTVARFGGDEFVILLEELNEKTAALQVANQILEKVRKPFQVDNQTINVTTSIGIAFYNHDIDIGDEEFIIQADQALYLAKKAGKNTFCVYEKP